MTKRLLCVGVFLSALGVTACSGTGHPLLLGQPAQPVVAAPDVVNMRLAEAVERASKSLETMSLVEQSRTPVDTSLDLTDTPEELKQTVTISWVGPVENVAALLADVSGYTFNTIGNPPATPTIVSVEATERPVIEILRSLGLQTGKNADVSVNAEQRVVEVRYAPASTL